jgi:hypothetical protein
MADQHEAGDIHPLAALEAIVRWCGGKGQGRDFEITFFPVGTLPGYSVGIFDVTVFDDGDDDEIGVDGATLEAAILGTYESMKEAGWFARVPPLA